MTLGGFTIAIGALVDDAIIDVENVFRRLREEHRKPEAERRSAFEVVFRASSEVRGAMLFATLVIALVFIPLLVLGGLEGRLLRPLGHRLPRLAHGFAAGGPHGHARAVPAPAAPRRRCSRPRSRGCCGCASAPTTARCPSASTGAPSCSAAPSWRSRPSFALLPFLGRSFLPPFNEGSLTVALVSPLGTTLADGDEVGREVEKALLAFPEVVSTSRRTGRAEKDEHVQGVNASEMEVVLRPGRPKPELLAEMRRAVATIPGVSVSFGQPISHRIDHMISGSKTNLAVKVFGPDLAVLRGLSAATEKLLRGVPGIVDLSNQEQASVPQLLVDFDRQAMARFGLTPADMAQSVEALFQGAAAGEVVEGGLTSRVVVRFPERLRAHRDDLEALPVTTPGGAVVRLGDVARVRFDLGPGLVRRENVQRLAMVTANVAGSDLAGRRREGAGGRGRGAAAARRLPGRLRRAVRGGGAQPAQPRGARGRDPGRDVRAALRGLRQPPAHPDRARQPAARDDRRRDRGGGGRGWPQCRLPRRLHHALRDRHAQRRPARDPLRAPDARGRAAAA